MTDFFKYHYRAYGLNIASQIHVVGFDAISAEMPDVTIKEGKVIENLDNIINNSKLFQSNDHEFLLRFDPVGAFYVGEGNSIIIQRNDRTTDSDVSSCLTGICFGAVLHQRKLLPIHASTVIINNKCLVFAGVSGAGKTTTTVAMIKAGGTLVADDVSVIDFSGAKPSVRPAFPAVKIWADSLSHLGIPVKGLVPVRGEIQKYYLPVERFSGKPAAIDHLIILNKNNVPDFAFESIRGAEKFRLIKKYTYLFSGIPKTGLEINHFQLANRLVTEVPVSSLIRPIGGFDTDRLIEFISKNV
ncbi:MAG TPA: hypothetical protein VHI78_04850 [Bacteroidales bacterium]|jgi:hypothetical protein|nr:hypothetical protein [Bacteroidales bacterium]